MLNILITGGSGFVGTALTNNLLKNKNYKILSVYHFNKPKICNKFYKNRIKFIKVDIKSNSGFKIIRTFKPNILIHLATKYIHSHDFREIDDILSSNIIFGTKIIEVAIKAGCRNFINTSSIWEYYHGKEIPVNLYAASKSAFGRIISYYHSKYPTRFITLMLSNSYGNDDKRNKLIPNLIKNYQKKKEIKFSKGDQILDFTHIEDIVDAYKLLIKKICKDKKFYNYKYFLKGENISLNDLLYLFVRIFKPKFKIMMNEIKYREREVMKPVNKKSDFKIEWTRKKNLKNTLIDIYKNLK